MADFGYTTVPGKIKPLLDKIRGVGIPPKATVQWLKSIGFKSSNDTTLLGMLKAVGLVDSSNIPTPTWSGYRGAKHREVLGEAIKMGYAELFAVYPDAWQRSNTELEHVFATSTTAGKQVISKTVASFKALCECADFGSIGESPNHAMHTTTPLHAPVTVSAGSAQTTATNTKTVPSIHIDLQIHVSPEATPEQIDQIFKSMAKHLYGAKGD
jgi:hypothetical protein